METMCWAGKKRYSIKWFRNISWDIFMSIISQNKMYPFCVMCRLCAPCSSIAPFTPNPFALRSKKCCRTGSNCVQMEWTWWQLFALCVRTFLNVMNGLEREGCLRTSTLLKILRTPSRSEIGRTDIVLKTTWTNFERNCRTSNLLWTLCNVV